MASVGACALGRDGGAVMIADVEPRVENLDSDRGLASRRQTTLPRHQGLNSRRARLTHRCEFDDEDKGHVFGFRLSNESSVPATYTA